MKALANADNQSFSFASLTACALTFVISFQGIYKEIMNNEVQSACCFAWTFGITIISALFGATALELMLVFLPIGLNLGITASSLIRV